MLFRRCGEGSIDVSRKLDISREINVQKARSVWATSTHRERLWITVMTPTKPMNPPQAPKPATPPQK